jgi:hypothetical protein
MFIQTLARILADKFNLEVRYSDTAKTFSIGKRPDGRLVITLANRLLEANGEREEAIGTLFRGALAHEALGHGYHTTFEEAAFPKEGPFARGLANCFEDVRIEALAPERFVGARRLLADMVRELESSGFWSMPGPDDWQGALACGLLRKYRWKILRQPLDVDLTERMLNQAIAAIGPEMFRQVDSLAESACRASNTAETSDYADQIVRLLRTAEPPSPPPQPPRSKPSSDQSGDDETQSGGSGGDDDNGDDSNAGPDDSTSSDGNSGKDEAGKDSTEGAGNGGSSDGSEGDDEAESVGSGNQPGDTDQDCDQPGVGNQPEQGDDGEKDDGQARTGHGRSRSDGPPAPFNPEQECNLDVESAMDEAMEPGNGNVKDGGLSASFDDLTRGIDNVPNTMDVAASARLAGRIAAKLGDALRSITEDADDDESDRGRLDLGRLPAILAGATSTPFTVDGKPGRGINTEIMLVMDQSSSMTALGKGFLRDLLCASLTSLGRFSPDLGVSFATFNTGSTLIIRPGRHITPNLAAKVASAYTPDGGTSWAKSVAPLVPILAQSHRARRIMLTITDGQTEASMHEGLARDLRYHNIGCRFVSIGHLLHEGFEGISCESTPASFADAFCGAILATLPPEYA